MVLVDYRISQVFQVFQVWIFCNPLLFNILCWTLHGVGELYFNGRRLIPDRCGNIIDRAPSIEPIDDVSSVEQKSSFVR